MERLNEARAALAQRGHTAEVFPALPMRWMYGRAVPALWTEAPPGAVAEVLPGALGERCGDGWAYCL